MPPKIPLASTKKQEHKTYRALGLGRALKSAASRRALERGGLWRVVGPRGEELAVPLAQYRTVRTQVARAFLQEAKARGVVLPAEKLLAALEPAIETRTQEELLGQAQRAAALEEKMLAAQGRTLTAHERRVLMQTAGAHGSKTQAPSTAPNTGAARHRRRVVSRVLGRVQARQTSSPARLRTAWLEAVGEEIAGQSNLERIDVAAGIAWFRCHNSALSHRLQRQPRLAETLSKLLGQKITQVRIRY